MVEITKNAQWDMNTDFVSALQLILDAIINQKLTPENVEDMVLAIFSDMQIDNADREFKNKSSSLFDTINRKYSEAGMKLWGKPFKTPHILFWNLRSTKGFPTLSTFDNCSMMSGFSPALLNGFCEEGISVLKTCTPWSLFKKSINNERYKALDDYIRDYLNNK